jgi:hypothetical protein
VSYPADDETTASFCKRADVRVIWGGNKTTTHICAIQAMPRCVDVVFPDRYSIAVINAEANKAADEVEIKRLAQNFYNDTYLMDQNACSSPMFIFWLNKIQDAKERFWNAVLDVANQKYDLQPAVAMDKYVQFCHDAIDYGDAIELQHKGNLLYRVNFRKLPPSDLTAIRGKGGYFYEYDLTNPNELAPDINEKYQTITYYGLNARNIKSFVIKNKQRGIDRIVPIGSAMDIGLLWDGYDLVNILSRRIEAR